MQSIDIAFPTKILYLLLNKQIFNNLPTTLNWEFGVSNRVSSGEDTPVAWSSKQILQLIFGVNTLSFLYDCIIPEVTFCLFTSFWPA